MNQNVENAVQYMGFFYKNSDGSHTCSHCYAIIEEQKEKEEKEKEFEEYQIWHNIFRK